MTSCGKSNSEQASAAAFIVGQSESLPIKIPTTGLEVTFFIVKCVTLKCNVAHCMCQVVGCNAGSIPRRPVSKWRVIAEFLALKRNTGLLLIALVLAGTGEKLWQGFVPKYLQTLGGSILIVGIYDALQTLLGALYAYPGGWLTDKWGQRRSLMLFSALSLAGYILVLLWAHWLALLLGSFLFLA